MTTDKPRRPTVLQAVTLTGAGIALAVYGGIGVLEGLTGTGTETTINPIAMAAFCLGALLFSVGVMVLIVTIVRPLFEKRPQDAGTDRPR